MAQQINLFNPAFESRRSVLSLKGAVTGWIVVAALCAAFAAYQVLGVRSAEQQDRDLSAQVLTAQAEAQRLGAETAKRNHDPKVAEELARLEGDVKGRQEVMEILKSGSLGDTRGFSDHLKAFARQSFDGVWLTGLSIGTGGKEVSVEGRATQAAFVPGYLKRLNGESAMQGHPFSELVIQEPPTDPSMKAQPRPDYVEFKLTTKTEQPAKAGTQ